MLPISNRDSGQVVNLVDGVQFELKVGKQTLEVGVCDKCQDFILREIPGAHLERVLQDKLEDEELAQGLDQVGNEQSSLPSMDADKLDFTTITVKEKFLLLSKQHVKDEFGQTVSERRMMPLKVKMRGKLKTQERCPIRFGKQ